MANDLRKLAMKGDLPTAGRLNDQEEVHQQMKKVMCSLLGEKDHLSPISPLFPFHRSTRSPLNGRTSGGARATSSLSDTLS